MKTAFGEDDPEGGHPAPLGAHPSGGTTWFPFWTMVRYDFFMLQIFIMITLFGFRMKYLELNYLIYILRRYFILIMTTR